MISNYKEFKNMLSSLTYRPKLLLHSCCGPCSSYTILFLNKYFDLDIFYSNDNIYPYEEFLRRSEEQKRLVKELGFNINVVVDTYDSKRYYDAVSGLENLGEHSKRCYMCYKLRLKRAAEYAKNNGYEYFTTTLSISPYKNASWINELGYMLEDEIGIKYLYSDFKKEEGYKESIRLSREYNLYRQDYCGCVFSKEERDKK